MWDALKKLLKRKKKEAAGFRIYDTDPWTTASPRVVVRSTTDSGTSTSYSGTTVFYPTAMVTPNEVSFNSPADYASPVGDDKRLEKKPIEVFEEILKPVPEFECNPRIIGEEIRTVEHRIKVLREHMTEGFKFNDEEEALGYLNARLKFAKYRDYFVWLSTTDVLIKELTTKYKVQRVGIQGYYKTMPMEAVEAMEAYAKAWKYVAHKKQAPAFELIVDSGGPEKRRDPILFAKSPFGRWYYVLGAWDREVQILGKLIYGNESETLKHQP